MKLVPTVLLCVAGAAIGAGLGWLLRGTPTPSELADVSRQASGPGDAAAQKPKPGAPRKNHGDQAIDAVSAELARQSGALRWLYLLGAADKATASDMPRLLQAASGLPGALRMLAVHWAQLDPRHMFETLCAGSARYRAGGDAEISANYDLPHILFEEWTKKDPEAAIAALHDRSALPRVDSLRFSLTNTIMRSDPGRGMKLMSDWNITSFLPDLSAVAKWAAQDPRAAAEIALESSLGHATQNVMERIGKQWAAKDPGAALTLAAEKRGLPAIHLAQSVMTEWAHRDLQAAIAHVSAHHDPFVLARLGLPLVEAWAKTDPQAALLWASGNLKGEARAAAAASVVKTMAASDINGAAQFIATLDPGGARDRAIGQLIDIWVGSDMYNKQNRANATAALAWMASLPEADARQEAGRAAWRLMYYAPEETVAFLSGPQGASAPQELFNSAAQHLARKNPDTAMTWAAALPPDRRAAAQHSVLNEWVNTRPDAAMEWVRQLPAGETRARSVTGTTALLAFGTLETTRRWLESLPAPDRPAALAGLKSNASLNAGNRAALEAALK